MLKQIAKALNDFDEKGVAVIHSTEDNDSRDIAPYVVSVLNDLKCDFDHYYHDVEDSYIIVTRMTDIQDEDRPTPTVKQLRAYAEKESCEHIVESWTDEDFRLFIKYHRSFERDLYEALQKEIDTINATATDWNNM